MTLEVLKAPWMITGYVAGVAVDALVVGLLLRVFNLIRPSGNAPRIVAFGCQLFLLFCCIQIVMSASFAPTILYLSDKEHYREIWKCWPIAVTAVAGLGVIILVCVLLNFVPTMSSTPDEILNNYLRPRRLRSLRRKIRQTDIELQSISSAADSSASSHLPRIGEQRSPTQGPPASANPDSSAADSRASSHIPRIGEQQSPTQGPPASDNPDADNGNGNGASSGGDPQDVAPKTVTATE